MIDAVCVCVGRSAMNMKFMAITMMVYYVCSVYIIARTALRFAHNNNMCSKYDGRNEGHNNIDNLMREVWSHALKLKIGYGQYGSEPLNQ